MYKVFLLFFLSIFVASPANAEDLKIISTDDLNPQEKINTPTGVVDAFGNLQYKYPVNKSAPNEANPPKKVDTDAKKAEPEKPKFLKGPVSQWSVEVDAALIGSLNGMTLGLNYQKNHWGGGARVRYLLRDVPEMGDSFNLMIADVKLGYHFYPVWYSKNRTKGVFDPQVFVTGGMLNGKSTLGQEMSLVTMSLGVAVGYQVNPNWSVRIGTETLQTTDGYLGINSFGGVSYHF